MINLENSVDLLKKELIKNKKSNSDMKDNRRSRYNSFSLIENDNDYSDQNIVKNLFGKTNKNKSENEKYSRSPLKYYSSKNSDNDSESSYNQESSIFDITKKLENIKEIITNVCKMIGNKLEKTISKLRSLKIGNSNSKENSIVNFFNFNSSINEIINNNQQSTPVKEKKDFNEINSNSILNSITDSNNSIGRKRLNTRSSSDKKDFEEADLLFSDKFMNYTVTPVKKSKSANLITSIEKGKIETEFLMNKMNTLNLDEINIQQSNKLRKI